MKYLRHAAYTNQIMNIPHFSYKNSCLFSEEVVYFLKATKIRALQQLLKSLTYNYTTLFIRLSRKNANIMEFSY